MPRFVVNGNGNCEPVSSVPWWCVSPHLDAMSAGCLVLRCPSDSRSSHTPIIKQNVNVLDFLVLSLDVCSRYVSTLWLNIWHSPEELQRNPKEVNFT